MSSSTSNLDLISASQAGKEITANSLFDAASASMLFGRRASTTAALTWGYYGGNISVAGVPTAVPNGTVMLTGSTTNYIEANAAGVVSKNTVGFTSGSTQLYKVVTDTGSVSGYTDLRLSGPTGATDSITGTTGPTAGNATVTGGTATTAGNPGGAAVILGGSGAATGNSSGGAVTIRPGAPTGTGTAGNIQLDGGRGAALATTATGGFVLIPSCAGAPTGTPASLVTGTVPMVFDTTNSKFWIYTGTAWKGVVVA